MLYHAMTVSLQGLQWSPSSQLVAVGSYDQSVRLLNNLTWSKIVEFKHKHTIEPSATLVRLML